MKVKRLLCALLVIAVIASIAAVSFAAETRAAPNTFNFTIPYPTQLQISSGVKTTGTFNAWATTIPTTITTRFWISSSSADAVGTKVTDGVNFTTPATNYFTYYTGHGGANYRYFLVAGCPVGTEYTPYVTRGTWSPG